MGGLARAVGGLNDEQQEHIDTLLAQRPADRRPRDSSWACSSAYKGAASPRARSPRPRRAPASSRTFSQTGRQDRPGAAGDLRLGQPHRGGLQADAPGRAQLRRRIRSGRSAAWARQLASARLQRLLDRAIRASARDGLRRAPGRSATRSSMASSRASRTPPVRSAAPSATPSPTASGGLRRPAPSSSAGWSQEDGVRPSRSSPTPARLCSTSAAAPGGRPGS